MPRYFFHSADGTRDRDTDGTELPDQAAARKEGIKYAGLVMAEQPDSLWDGRDFRVEVADEAQQLLFTIIMLAIDAPAAEEKTP